MNEILIECKDVTHGYQRGSEFLTVLDGLNLQIHRGDFVALMGPSGSGKSTLLNLLGGLEQPKSGSICIQNVEITSLSNATLTDWRACSVGFIFQFYNLLPVLSAQANVELPLLLTQLSRKQRKQHARLALDIVGMADRADHKPAELSGGQQQRVAIARAIVADAQLLVCDEPTGDLDRATADDVLRLLKSLNEEHGKTIVMVTHDPKAASYAGSVLHMDKGMLTRQPQAAAAMTSAQPQDNMQEMLP